LWPDWKPTPQTIKFLFDRWGFLYQDKLRDAVEVHRLEASAEKAGRPVFNRVMELYQQRTQVKDIETTKIRAKQINGPSEDELQEWARWADQLLASASADERAAVQARLPIPLLTKRAWAAAIEYCREHPTRQ
jgi:hypothetical protein